MTTALLDRIRQNNFKALAGTSLHFKIPLTRAFINWNAKQALPDKIESIKIQSIQGRIIMVNIETTIPLLPVFDITLELYEKVRLPQLAVSMKIVDGLGWLARSVVDKFLPAGIDLHDKVLTIDLRHFLSGNKKYGTLLDKITFAQWAGATDKLLLELELRF